MKTNPENIKMKRQYVRWLGEGRGFAPSTINQIALSIGMWEEFTNGRDFRQFDPEMVKKFKQWLQERISPITGKPLTLVTLRNRMTHLSGFYQWLSSQPGYKSKILATDYRYFHLDNKLNRIALNRPRKRIPTLEIIKKIVMGIDVKTDIDRRDQALIAFAFLSAMRIEAIISLPLGCFNGDRLGIRQDPAEGVRTKFAKRISTTLFAFDKDLVKIVTLWSTFLRKEKLFTESDPLFPAPKTVEVSPGNYDFAPNELDRKFWAKTNSAREIWKKRCREAGVEYFSPHTFRHAAVNEALARCHSPADLKAISVNIGHSKISTTLFQYGDISDEERDRRIRQLTDVLKADDEALKTLRELVDRISRKKEEDQKDKDNDKQ